MMYYAEINYYNYIGEKSLRFNACGKGEEPPEGYNVNEVNHRLLAKELFGYFWASTEEGAKLRALNAFTAWLKNHMTTIETTISYLDENVKEIEGRIEKEKKKIRYVVSYNKSPSGRYRWVSEREDLYAGEYNTATINVERGCVFVEAFSHDEAIKLGKKEIYKKVYEKRNSFDPLLTSCGEAFRS